MKSSYLTPSDEKRLKSLSNKRNLYNEQKSLIKNALANIDNISNKKIKFDDDDNEEIVVESKSSVVQITKPRNNKESKKATLFDDESDEDDDIDINFDIKQQFEGATGEKLMKLQSGYKNDKRFVLDKRFVDDGDENPDKSKEDPEDIEMIDAPEEDERKKQMEILDGILGTQRNVPKRAANVENGKKAAPIKTMLRFDPSKPDHSIYVATPAEKEVVKKKKHKKEIVTEASKPVIAAPEVSKERFYKIDETLTQSLGSEQPFSLLSLFGKNVEENLNENDSYKSKPLTSSKASVKNPLEDGNAFKYDSSDSEEDSKAQTNGHAEPSVPQSCLTLVSTEKFFFTNNDPRFKEALEFFASKRDSNEHNHIDFKRAINKRVQNMKSERNRSKNNKMPHQRANQRKHKTNNESSKNINVNFRNNMKR